MYQLIAPKMRFSVVLTENPNRPKYNQYNNNSANNNSHVCYADSYDIKADGSLTFYQTAILIGQEKKVKVPVMTYPNGKWDACVLIADDGSYPIFTGKGVLISDEDITSQPYHAPTVFKEAAHKEVREETSSMERPEAVEDSEVDDEPRRGFNPNAQAVVIEAEHPASENQDAFSMLDSEFDLPTEKTQSNGSNHGGTGGFNRHAPAQVRENFNTPWHTTQQESHTQSGNQQPPQPMPFQSGNSHMAPQVGQGHIGQQPHMTIPGMNPQNTADFKKAKNDFIETQIKEHLRSNDKFELQSFLVIINKESRQKNFGRISEADVEWIATRLIRDKVVLTKYFVNPVMQKTLSLDVKDILRRQWNGKMGPILQVLKERENTKNVTAIDLAVWMVQNKFE